MAAIITGASVVFESSRTGSYGLIGTEVVGAIDAGLELLGSDAVKDPGRLLWGSLYWSVYAWWMTIWSSGPAEGRYGARSKGGSMRGSTGSVPPSVTCSPDS